MKKPLVVIVGPTAVGKTDISISVAKRLNSEIISADSMQIYKYMDIGTAKPTKGEMQGIPHYLIDEIEPDEEFNVALFQQKAFKYIDYILEKKKTPMVVGGTGLYVNSLVYPLNFTESISDPEYRIKIQALAKEKGNQYIHDLLKQVDSLSAEAIHPNNTKRIIRALEVYKNTGKTMSYYKEKTQIEDIPFSLVMIGLMMDRDILYQRINQRIDNMIEEGLIDEVKGLLDKGYDKDLVSMQGLGYKEIIGFLEGQLTLEESINLLKRDTRRFAKRQLTWFRRDKRIHWIKVDEYTSKADIIDDIIMLIETKFPFSKRV
ncbi:tRNA (adenosine(37)-N6)-dimethylallyltransferase MiaA [Irregularibacter muris]|uniref:tRNA dimethylallyltransferase n=1 Tax=Irregularibacter muris TaxID=1796619 RepID=A0AAE3HD19_9FIRM|nr:tRNA (adenosine(37)-N6)-dimethylallyltransferase MiaA [Irregularibacter muris]MCR1898071.1 tRNA (adenosine(37)-N6)-dimethylallyltransferase MiaA [Irregularibacter muris]